MREKAHFLIRISIIALNIVSIIHKIQCNGRLQIVKRHKVQVISTGIVVKNKYAGDYQFSIRNYEMKVQKIEMAFENSNVYLFSP